MKKFLSTLLVAILVVSGCSGVAEVPNVEAAKTLPSTPLVDAARKQIGVVTSYDTSYYKGGYPPSDRGACTDVIARALKVNGYDIKAKIDADMKKNPKRYVHTSDPNINFRRVRNVKNFLDFYAKKLSTSTDKDTLKNGTWKAGDIVTFDQIPGSLWHIAIVSNKTQNGVPLLIHNYGHGTVEDNKLLTWPAPITGHYRLSEV